MIFDSLGIGEMGVVLALAVILVEPKKLGKVMKEFAKFKRKLSQIQAEVKSQLDAINLEEDARERNEKLKGDKASLRDWGRDQVKTLTATARSDASLAVVEKIAAWPTYQHAKVVSCYSGTLQEMDTEPLLRRILADGKTLLMPFVIAGPDEDKTVEKGKGPEAGGLEAGGLEARGPEAGKAPKTMGMAQVSDIERDLSEGAFGIQEPKAELRHAVECPKPDLIFVPGTCFDLRGGRLGQGLGFYDRYLPGTTAVRAALGFDVQITEKNLALDHHDQLMDVLISEKRILMFSAPALPSATAAVTAEPRVDAGPA